MTASSEVAWRVPRTATMLVVANAPMTSAKPITSHALMGSPKLRSRLVLDTETFVDLDTRCCPVTVSGVNV
jgi:hypothetical protein